MTVAAPIALECRSVTVLDGVRERLGAYLPLISVLAMVAYLIGPLAWADGGRDPHVMTIGAMLTALAVLATRPHQVLSFAFVGLSASVSLAAFAVAVWAPTGWAGSSAAARYACAAWVPTAVVALIRERPAALEPVAALLPLAAAAEFAQGWLAWWGGGDPTREMIGTFYWHNPYAAFLLPGALVGLWLWIVARRAVALIGLTGFVLGSTGIVYSTSRATLACLGAGVVIAAVTVGTRAARTTVLRGVIALGIAAAVVKLIVEPPFFAHGGSVTGGIAARAAGESLTQNGLYRLDFWREALVVFRAHPLIGGGYHSLAAESIGRVPRNWPLSPFAHNGYLQALATGGLVLSVPFLTAAFSMMAVSARSLVRGLVRRRASLATVVLPAVFLLVCVHSAVDFDWAYPANMALAGIVGGLALAARPQKPVPLRADHGGYLRAVTVGVAVLVLALAAWSGRHGDRRQSLPIPSGHSAAAVVKDVTRMADSHHSQVTDGGRQDGFLRP